MKKLLLTLGLLLSIVSAAYAETKSINELLNPDNSLNLTTGWSGNIDLMGKHVVLDPLKGPVAVSPNDWKALGSGIGNNINDGVFAIGVYGTDVYVGGQFTTAGGIAALNIAKWNGSTWSAIGAGANNTVRVIKVFGDEIYFGGAFTSINSMAAHIVKLNGSTSVWSFLGDATGNGVLGTVWDIVPTNEYVYVSGTFQIAQYNTTTINNCNGVARWNKTTSTWQNVGNGVQNANGFPFPYALAVNGNDVYVGGNITIAGGNGTPSVAASNIAKWDGTTWTTLSGGLNGFCHSLLFDGGILYAGGNFTTAGGNPANYIAKWDGTNWSAMGSGFIGLTNDIVKVGSTIYATGTIPIATSVPNVSLSSLINKWNGTAWETAEGGIIGGNSTCYVLSTDGTSLYAGGRFTQAGFNTPVNNIAKYTPNLPPVNDDCTNAISLTHYLTNPNPSVRNVFSTTNGTESQLNCVGVGSAKDVWFSFVANTNILRIGADGSLILTNLVGTNLADPVIELFSGTCGSLVQVGCFNNTTTQYEKQDFENLVAGTTYYFRVYDANGGTGNFEIYLDSYNRNGLCTDAETLTPVNTVIPSSYKLGTTRTRRTCPSTECLNCANSNQSISVAYYKFTAASSFSKVIIQTSGLTAAVLTPIFKVFNDCSSFNSPIGCFTEGVTTDGFVEGVVPTVIGNTYYIQVINVDGNAVSRLFNIAVENADNFLSAPTIPFGCDWQTVTGNTANASNLTTSVCTSVGAKSIWYKFAGVAGDQFAIDVTSGTITSPGGIVHYGTASSLISAQTVCFTTNASGGVTMSGTCTATADHYIRVYSNGGTNGTFTLRLRKTNTNHRWSGGGGDNLWSNANNWSPNCVPTSTSTATIEVGSIVILDGNYTINSLNWNGGTITNNGSARTLMVNNGGTITADNTQLLTTNTTLSFLGGTVNFNSPPSVNNYITINGYLNNNSTLIYSTNAPEVLGTGTVTNAGTITRPIVGTGCACFSTIFTNSASGSVGGSNSGILTFKGGFTNHGTITGNCGGGISTRGDCTLMAGTVLNFTDCGSGSNLSGIYIGGSLYDYTTTGLTIPVNSHFTFNSTNPSAIQFFSRLSTTVNNGYIRGNANCLISGSSALTNSSTGTISADNSATTTVTMTINSPLTNLGTMTTGVADVINLPFALSYGGVFSGVGTFSSPNLTPTGTIKPAGASPGKLTLDPSVISNASTVYELDITGGYGVAGIADDADKVESPNSITLAGSLKLVLNNPAVGSYPIFNAVFGLVSGFNTMNVSYSVNGAAFTTTLPPNMSIQVNPKSIVVNVSGPVGPYIFTNAGGNNLWTNPSNWQFGTIPPNPLPTTEKILMQATPIVDIDRTIEGIIESAGFFLNLEINSGRTLTVAGTGILQSTLSGTFINIFNRGTLVNNGTITCSLGNANATSNVENNGTMTLEKINILNFGIINNNATGIMTIKAGFSNEASSIFNNRGVLNNDNNSTYLASQQFSNQNGGTLNNILGGTFNQNGKFLSSLSTTINNHGLFKINAGVGVSSTYQGIFNNKPTGVLELNANIVNSGTPTPTFNNEGTITGQGGLLQSFNFINSGNIKPNNNGAGRITINGGSNLRLGTGTLHIDIGGTTVTTTYDQFNANGVIATLQGNLVVNLINSFVPAVGNSFAIVVYNTNARVGTFGSVSLPNIAPNRWQTSYGTSSMTLTVLPPIIDYTFTNANNDNRWDEPQNWTPNGVPSTIYHNVTLNSGFTVLLETNRTIGNFIWAGGAITATSAKTLVATIPSTTPLFTDNSHVIGNNVTLDARSGSFWTVGSTAPNTHTMTIDGALINRGSFLLSTTYAVNILGSGSLTNYNFINRSNVGPANITPVVYNKPTGIVVGSNDGRLCFVGDLYNEGTISGYCNGAIRILANGYLMNGTVLSVSNCSDITRISGIEVVGTLIDQTTSGITIPASTFLHFNNPAGNTFFTTPQPITNNGIIRTFNDLTISSAVTNSATGTIEADNSATTGITLTLSGAVTNNGTVKTGSNDKVVFSNGLTTGTTGLVTGSGTLEAVGSTFILRGTIAPGASPGTMTINGNVTNASNTNYQMELEQSGATTLHDKLIVTGTFDGANATMNVVEIGAGTIANGTYDLVECQGGANCILNGFNSVTKPANYSVVVTGTKISVVKNVALPIELINFSAKINNKKAELNWQTASEINVKNFEIEKSFDSKFFNKIEGIKANNTPSVYSAFDDQFSESAYYRLKINDLDGTSNYSKIVFLEKDSDKNIKITRNTEGSILIETNDKIELITMTNPIGQLIKSTKEKQFFINEFNSGIYIISVKTDKGFLSKKIFKE